MRSGTFIQAIAATCLLAAPSVLRAQVFVVGEKTATADVVTEFHATHVDLPVEPMDQRGRLDLIRNLEAEQGFAHRELPLGAGLELQANGNMTPREEAYKRMLYEKGQSASPGDRVEITALQFRPDRIVLDSMADLTPSTASSVISSSMTFPWRLRVLSRQAAASPWSLRAESRT